MKVTVSKFDLSKVAGEVLAVGVFEGKASGDKMVSVLDRLASGVIARFLSKNKTFGKQFESSVFFIPSKNHPKIEKIVLVGLGKLDKFDDLRFKQVCGYIGKNHAKDVKSVSAYFPSEAKSEQRIESAVVAFANGVFDPGHQKGNKDESEKSKVESFELLADQVNSKMQEDAKVGQLIADAICKVREVSNLPANIVTPKYMADFAKKIAGDNKLKAQIFTEKQVNEMGMHIMGSVAKGSEQDLYFAVLEYRGATPKGGGPLKTLALIGKGITFDSGGISIKPSESMELMKMDMAGAAAVLAAISVIAKLKPAINVVAATPLTENLPSGKASKPGDVVRGLSGKTVEIINTDAEGRLVLADAITYVQKNFKPDYIVDVATLTGASVVALGNWASAVLGRPQSFIDDVIKVSQVSGERFWQLPLYDEYRDQLKSYIADIANVSSTRGGGTETGAKFIEEFVDEKVAWAHLDIAPTAWEENEKPYQCRGATGFGVTTLVNLARKLAK